MPIFALAVSVTVTLVLVTTGTGLLFHEAPHGKRIGCIDGLRGYLAIFVLMHHFIIWAQTREGAPWSPPSANLLNNFGVAAVALFFMVTGCLFYPIVLAGFRETRWTSVYVRRVFRIMPLVALSVAIIALIALWRTPNIEANGGTLIALMRWLSAWGEPDLFGYHDTGRVNAYVLWSLRYEWIFYVLLLPACALASDLLSHYSLPSYWIPIGLVLACVPFRSVPLAQYVPLFAIGMIAFEVQRSEMRPIFTKPRLAVIALGGIAIAANVWSTPINPWSMPFWGLFFICVACGNNFFGLFSSSAANILGECSFGIYLLHGIILNLLFNSLLVEQFSQDTLFFLMPCAALLTVIVSAISFRYVESPMNRFGWRLSSYRRTQLAG